MTRGATLAIAICTLDNPSGLRRCIRAAVSEPLLSQVIVMSDGLDSETDEVTAEAARIDGRVTLQHGPRLGMAASKNACVDVCDAEFILFLEDHNELLPGFVEEALRHVDRQVIVTGRANARLLAAGTGSIFPTDFLRRKPFHEAYCYDGDVIEIALCAAHLGLTIVNLGMEGIASTRNRVAAEGEHSYYRGLHDALLYGRYRRSCRRLVGCAIAGAVSEAASSGGGSLRTFGAGFVHGLRARERRPAFPKRPLNPCRESLSVVIPTYRRADRLLLCLEGLARQLALPDEVVVVRRPEDLDAAAVIARAPSLPVLREVLVHRPGQVAALAEGARHSTGDLVALIDDDVVCRPDWTLRLRQWFARPDVAGVGGRDVAYWAGEMLGTAPAYRVGILSRWGKPVGNHHRGAGPARWVDILKGCNMAYRRSALAFPSGLRGSGAEVANDMATSLRARSIGLSLIYDPGLIVDHYPAERFDGDNRLSKTSEAHLAAVRNEVAAIVSARPDLIVRYVVFHALVGHRVVPGLLRYPFLRLQSSRSARLSFWSVFRAMVSQAWSSWRRPLDFIEIQEN